MVRPLSRGFRVKILIGVCLGVLLILIASILFTQTLFSEVVRPKQYYLKTDLTYLYINVYNTSESIPLLGDKVLLNYVVIVRVENPYNDKMIRLENVYVSMPEQVYVQCSSNSTITINATVTMWKNNLDKTAKVKNTKLTPGISNITRPLVIFDSWINKSICAHGYTNDLFRRSARKVFSFDCSDCWIPGSNSQLNYKYVVITGVIELPKPWYYRLNKLNKLQYIVIQVEAHTSDNDYAEALKILLVPLNKVNHNTYVYNTFPLSMSFDLDGNNFP